MSDKQPSTNHPTVSDETNDVQIEQLIGYALGTLDLRATEEMEAQLMSSQETLAMYLAVKRSLQSNQRQQAPSAAAKQRLRAAVQARYAPSPWQRAWQWLQQPIPLYKSIAAAGVIAILAALLWFWWPQTHSPNTTSPMIDSSSQGTEQLEWS